MRVVRLKTPEGREIRGILERVLGCARSRTYSELDDGTLVPDYVGGRDIWWDSNERVMRNDESIYLDEDGLEWPESKLIRVSAEEKDVELWP